MPEQSDLTVEDLLRQIDEYRRLDNPPTPRQALADALLTPLPLFSAPCPIKLEPQPPKPVASLMTAPLYVSARVASGALYVKVRVSSGWTVGAFAGEGEE